MLFIALAWGLTGCDSGDTDAADQGGCAETGNFCSQDSIPNTNFGTQESCEGAGHMWVGPLLTPQDCAEAGYAWVLPSQSGGTNTSSGGNTNDTDVDGTGGGGSSVMNCVATATATLSTDQGDLVYTDATVAATAKHEAALGCTNELAIALDQSGGCALSLTFQTIDGAWSLSTGSLTVDEACGAGVAATAHGSYSLAPNLSTGAMGGTPTVSDTNSNTCMAGSALELKGLALFNGDGGKTLEVNLTGLSIAGDVLSIPAAGGGCPSEIVTCPEQDCGTDAYGTACGSCGDGFACMEGECIVWNCPPEAPFGTHPGKSLTNVELKDCDGNSVWLHELCGADAAFFNLLAGW